jgi:hypothetical protein
LTPPRGMNEATGRSVLLGSAQPAEPQRGLDKVPTARRATADERCSRKRRRRSRLAAWPIISVELCLQAQHQHRSNLLALLQRALGTSDFRTTAAVASILLGAQVRALHGEGTRQSVAMRCMGKRLTDTAGVHALLVCLAGGRGTAQSRRCTCGCG